MDRELIIKKFQNRFLKHIVTLFVFLGLMLFATFLSTEIFPPKDMGTVFWTSFIISIIIVVFKIKKDKKINKEIVKEFENLAIKEGYKNKEELIEKIQEKQRQDYFNSLSLEEQQRIIDSENFRNTQNLYKEKFNKTAEILDVIYINNDKHNAKYINYNIDEKNGLLQFKNGHTWSYWNLNDIKNFYVKDNIKIETKGALKGAVAGAVLAGESGALIGSNVGKKTFSTTEYKFVITFDNGDIRELTMYHLPSFEKMNNLFINYAKEISDQNNSNKIENSLTTELNNLKELYDNGIITEEEFKLAKQKILK